MLLLILGLASCKKDDYRTDGGVATNNTTLSTYDYLAANAYKNFDTVLLIVDHFGLKDSVNKAGTFFAPTDYAIKRAMTDNNITTLDDLYKKINSKFVTQYMFSDTAITLNNAGISVKTYESWAGITAGISKIAGSYYVATTSLTYYTLQYVKINGVLDGTPGAPANDQVDAILRCQTSGIKTSSGTNLNVLANTAVVNLVGDIVPTELELAYTINLTQSNTDYTSTPVQLEASKIAAFFGIATTDMVDVLASGTQNLKYYNVEPNETLNGTYTANAPGFWLDANGAVTNWGDPAYLYAELNTGDYILNVGQYPGHAKVGDKYVVKQAFTYTKSDGILYTVIVTINVTLI
jgi:hypothetical protein